MKIKYWGTSAAAAIPAVFCACSVCREAREKGGRYLRTRSQFMIEDRLLVDFGSDTYQNSIKFGYDLSQLKNLIISHVHQDHFYADELYCRSGAHAHNMKSEKLKIHGSCDVEKAALKKWGITNEDRLKKMYAALEFMPLLPYESRMIDGIKATALPASHSTDNPFVYVFEKDGKAMLMHNDSGYFKPEVMEWLKKSGIKFDLVSYECTFGDREDDGVFSADHMSLGTVLEERKRLRENGNYKDTTIDVITHLSHNNKNAGYGNMLKLAEANNLVLAYDGLEIEF